MNNEKKIRNLLFRKLQLPFLGENGQPNPTVMNYEINSDSGWGGWGKGRLRS